MRIKNEEKKAEIFVVPTTNERYLCFFVKLDSGTVSDYNTVPKLRKNLREIFQNIEHIKPGESHDLWVPNFKFMSLNEDTSQDIGSMNDMPQVSSY